MDGDWRNAFDEFRCYSLGAGPAGPKFILYKYSHIAYQIKGNEAHPGVWGNRGIRLFISEEEGNKTEGNRVHNLWE